MILLWRRKDKTFLTVYCVKFGLSWFDDCSFLFLYTYFTSDRISEIKPVQSSLWALVSSAFPNFNMKHYKSVTILSNFQNVKTPCTNSNSIFKTFWRWFWFLNCTSFTRQVTCVRFLAVWKRKKHANRERNSYIHLDSFYLTCFVRVCEIFTAVVSELQRGHHVVL